MFVDSNQKDWDDHLPYVMAAYRATQHKSSGVTPNLLMLNREINYPLDLMVGPPPNQTPVQCPIQYVEWARHAMSSAFAFTHGQLGLSAKRQKRNYERGLKPREFTEGSWVWRWYPPLGAQKLGLSWVGPYLVIRRISYLTYKIQKDKESNPIVVHVDQLKPFHGVKHPINWLREPEIMPDTEGDGPQTLTHYKNEKQVSSEMPVQIRSRRERVMKPRDIYSPG
ncbi:MAG: hypothetical protein AB2705_16775 [Candidatus Thiodiazotropha sp.]